MKLLHSPGQCIGTANIMMNGPGLASLVVNIEDDDDDDDDGFLGADYLGDGMDHDA